jgi:hypothetical protein
MLVQAGLDGKSLDPRLRGGDGFLFRVQGSGLGLTKPVASFRNERLAR